MSFASEPSPFDDPHRDTSIPNLPPWPTTPHSSTDPHPTLIKSAQSAQQIQSTLSSQPSSPLPSAISDGLQGPSTGPWGKEPQIYGQPSPGLISPRETKSSDGTHFEKPEPYLRVRITALDRNRRDILIRFDSQTNLQNFTGTTYRNISRSYAEFTRFYEQIVYSNPQTIIPALPLAQTSAPTDEEDDRLVKVMLQRWFSRVCEDPILLQDEELRSFIESDFGYSPLPRIRRKASSGFSLLGRRPPDEDEQLVAARFELTRLETQYIEAAKAVDKLSQFRKAMSFAHADMGNKLIDVAANEVHVPLANATRKMGRSWHTYADIDSAQEISDRVILGDSLGYQGMNARSAKETLLQRSAVLEEYQDAVKNTIAKRRNIERMKASSNIRPERVDDALEELEEANKVEQHLHRRVEGISQNLHRALVRHSRMAHEDLTAALIEHARTNLMYEKQLLRELESLRPDIKAAADPAPPPTSLPAAAAIAPLASRSATMTGNMSGSIDGLPRQPISSGQFMPPSRLQTGGPPSHIHAPSPTSFMPHVQVVPSLNTPITPSTAGIGGAVPNAPPNTAASAISQNRTPITPGASLSVANGYGASVPGAPTPAQTPATSSAFPNAFPKTNMFTPGATVSTPGFPRTSQFIQQGLPSASAMASPSIPAAPPPTAASIVTPGFPRTSQFAAPNQTPTTPSGGPALVTPRFPRTNQFGTPAPTPTGFPRTGQFVSHSGNPSPSPSPSPLHQPQAAQNTGDGLVEGTPRSSSFASFPRTSQFAPGAQSPLHAGPGGVNGMTRSLSPAYDPSVPPVPPAKSPLGQSYSHGQFAQQQQGQGLNHYPAPPKPQYHQPALPSQLQNQQRVRDSNVDPLLGAGAGIGGNRIISSQPGPNVPPSLGNMSASIPSLPSTNSNRGFISHAGSNYNSPTVANGYEQQGAASGGDPLLSNRGMSQSMFITPSGGPLSAGPGGPLSAGMVSPMGSETGPLGGTVRGTIGRSGTPTRRLDAREAASKLANFL